MAFISPSLALVNPSLILPEIVMNLAQASGAFNSLATGNPMARLGEGDLYAYIKTLDVRTRVKASQAANANELPSATITAGYRGTATYLVRSRAEYDHHDQAAANNWGVALPEAYRLANRQGIYQQLRNGLLYGFNPANGEGLLNTEGAFTENLPADADGHTTAITYDNGAMGRYLLQCIQQIKARTYQMGIAHHFNILGPQRILGMFEYQGIVELTSYQRAGAGTASVATMVKDILASNGDTVEWSYDDTLIGKGAGGTDAVIINMTEITVPSTAGISTNAFAELAPNQKGCTIMLTDMVAPREIPTPIAGGAIDVLYELRASSGWAIRPESVSIISIPYS